MSAPASWIAAIRDADEYVASRIRDLCFSKDIEQNHLNADHILLDLLNELGFFETVTAFESVSKGYS